MQLMNGAFIGMYAGMESFCLFKGRGLWIAHCSTARICHSIYHIDDEILAFSCFLFYFIVPCRATIDIYSIAKAGKKDMVVLLIFIRFSSNF